MNKDRMSEKILSAWISTNKDRYPHKVAIIHDNTKMTYSDLHDHVHRLARGLTSLGVQKGDRVVLLLKNSPEFVISFFAIAEVGAVAVPLNVQYKEQELTDYLNDSQPKVVIALGHLVNLIRDVLSLTNNRKCAIVAVPDGKDGSFSYASLIKENLPLSETMNLLPENDVLCQYSSGSTGKPKKIVRTHSNLVWEAENYCSTVSMTGNDKILCVVPLFHAHGLGNCMLASNQAVATLVLMEDFNHRRVLQTIQEEQITVFPAVPFMASILADTDMKDKTVLSSLRLCFTAGAPLQRETFQKFHEKYGVFVGQLYGSTETGSVSINLDKDITKTAESVGLPMRNVEVEIFGEKGEILRPNEIGNIGIQSPAMINGYSGLEDFNRESFLNGYFFPGDLGRKDSAENLYITGRKTLFINIGGNKVNPSDVEMLLATHPKVKEVIVIGVKSHYGEESIKAVIVPNSPCSVIEIIEFCNGKIADFKIPKMVEFRKEIPKSPLGKVLRKYLY